ncbi:MAG: hypothetical protein ACQER7_15015 [Bacteroidota bacterium]
MNKDENTKYIWVIFFLLYLFLPVKSSSIDGIGYAAMVKQNQMIFLPHHLLYNWLGKIWIDFFHFFGEDDVLGSLKVMNAFTAALSLLVLDLILKSRGVEAKRRLLWVLLTGSSWCVMRFATENETYLVPVLFSLIGSLWFSRFLSVRKNKYLIYSGFFAALATLFHQLHFFWWLALLAGVFLKGDSLRGLIRYVLPAIIVPVTYGLVLVFYYETSFSFPNFIEFVFDNYYNNKADISFGKASFLLTPVGFIRAFIQVHGYIFNYSSHFFGLILIGAGIGIFLFILSVFDLKLLSFRRSSLKSVFVLIHIFAFILHLFFAFVSDGNAEFMVMLPFLTAIVLSGYMHNDLKFLTKIGLGIFFWNLFVALIPLAKSEITADRMVAEHVLDKKKAGDDDSVYILFNRPKVGNIVEYCSGNVNLERLKYIDHFNDAEELKAEIDSTLMKDGRVFTDCYDRPFTISRASLLIDVPEGVFTDYQMEKVDSAETLSGKYYLTKISK